VILAHVLELELLACKSGMNNESYRHGTKETIIMSQTLGISVDENADLIAGNEATLWLNRHKCWRSQRRKWSPLLLINPMPFSR